MNIKGVKYWDSKRAFLSQTDNPTEGLLKKVLKKYTKYYLETCGPTVACMCLLALGYDLTIWTPLMLRLKNEMSLEEMRISGVYIPQPEEVLQDWFNDKSTIAIREKIRKGVGHIPGNRIPQYYEQSVKSVFGYKVNVEFNWRGKNIQYLIKCLASGKAVHSCRKGHYIALLAFDYNTNEFIYNDPWPTNYGLKHKGFNERIHKDKFINGLATFCVVYG